MPRFVLPSERMLGHILITYYNANYLQIEVFIKKDIDEDLII